MNECFVGLVFGRVDIRTSEAFFDINSAFIGPDGNPKPAWNVWVQLIVPEFPSFLILPLLMLFTVFVVLVHKKRSRAHLSLNSTILLYALAMLVV